MSAAPWPPPSIDEPRVVDNSHIPQVPWAVRTGSHSFHATRDFDEAAQSVLAWHLAVVREPFRMRLHHGPSRYL